jgi:hypothetical protein
MMSQHKCTIGRQVVGWILSNGSSDGSFTYLTHNHSTTLFRKAIQFICLPIMLACTIAFLPGDAGAAEVKITPGIAVGVAYDDNIFFTSEDKVDSSILTVSPSLALDYKTLLSNLKLKADWDVLSYLDESDLNRTNQYYRLWGDRRIKDRWSTAVELKYYNDTTLNTYLQEIGRVIERIERDYFEAGGDIDYDMTLISGISVGYRYQNASYENDVYSDYYNHLANLYYYHRLKSEVDKLSFGPSFYHRKNDFNEVDSFSLDIGWDRDWSSITRSKATLGARYTEVTQNDGTKDDTWGAKASFDMRFTGTVSTTTFRYYHDLRTTVDGDDVNVDNFYLTYRRSITERFGAGLDGRLVFSYKLLNEQSNLNDERYYWVEPRMFYKFTEHLQMSLKYRYQNNVELRDEGDLTRERNIVWLELSYGLPILM